LKKVKKIQFGFTIMELLVSISVLGILLLSFSLTLNEFRKFNRRQVVKQQCISAAQAQLDSISVTGRQISAEDFNSLWPAITCSVEITEGNDQWKGLKLASVKTAGKSFSREITVNLSRFIRAKDIK
jgi:prepilin-type N-terminal cleavage/methylation domain-containing protein